MSFALPRTAVAATLALTSGEPQPGEIYLMDRVPHHDGLETVLELLNRPEGFFPFRPAAAGGGGGGGVMLVAKAHTVSLTVAGTPIADPARLRAAQSTEVEIVLEGGRTLAGIAHFELPDAHRRLLDYLNASREPFFSLEQGAATHYVNRAHVLYARPRD
jgi:hypothetical protein